jgi:hypothetical protein
MSDDKVENAFRFNRVRTIIPDRPMQGHQEVILNYLYIKWKKYCSILSVILIQHPFWTSLEEELKQPHSTKNISYFKKTYLLILFYFKVENIAIVMHLHLKQKNHLNHSGIHRRIIKII